MRDMDSVAEQVKLERLLDVTEGSLDFIAEQPSADTRAFREQLAEFFYRRHQDAFHRLAGLSKLLPLGASAKLATSLLGPVLAAGIACELPPERAAKLADKLPTDFLAKLSLYLDPRRAGPIISAVSENHIVAVADLLSEKQEFVTLARFVTSISKTALRRIIDNAGSDGYGLLKTGMFIEDKTVIDSLLRQLTDTQKDSLMGAATEHGLWPEMLSLITYLKPDMQILMANLAGKQSADVREKLLRSVFEQDTWQPLFVALAVMNDDNLKRSASLPAMHDQTLLRRLIERAREFDMEKELSPLLGYLNADQKALIA